MARIRHVFRSREIAHIWAQQRQDTGRNPQNNIFFRNRWLYSYRDSYPIGRIFAEMRDDRGNLMRQRIALIQLERFSISTGRHIARARGAVIGNHNVYLVPCLGEGYNGRTPTEAEDAAMHAVNLASYEERLRNGTDTAMRASTNLRMDSRCHQISNSLRNLWQNALAYCRDFGLDAPEYVANWNCGALIEQYDRQYEETQQRVNAREQAEIERAMRRVVIDPDLARLEPAHAERHRRMVAEELVEAQRNRKNLLSRAGRLRRRFAGRHTVYLSYSDRGAIETTLTQLGQASARAPEDVTLARVLAAVRADFQAIEDERIARRAQHELAVQQEREQRAVFDALPYADKLIAVCNGTYPGRWFQGDERRQAWRDGISEGMLGHLGGSTMLRVSPRDPETIETSRDATFPVKHALRVWRLLRRLYRTGGTYRHTNHALPLGHYRVDYVDEQGTVVAGCHTIMRDEIERLAVTLGVQEMAEKGLDGKTYVDAETGASVTIHVAEDPITAVTLEQIDAVFGPTPSAALSTATYAATMAAAAAQEASRKAAGWALPATAG